jgi:hypothetical protein
MRFFKGEHHVTVCAIILTLRYTQFQVPASSTSRVLFIKKIVADSVPVLCYILLKAAPAKLSCNRLRQVLKPAHHEKQPKAIFI